MGYMTGYSLTVCSARKNSAGLFEQLPKMTLEAVADEVDRMNVFEEGDAHNGWFAWTTWYDWEEDMILLSRKFNDVLFMLHGDGEDSEDLWDAYFLDGKIQVCPGRIVYDDFDPGKLEEKDIVQSKYSYQ